MASGSEHTIEELRSLTLSAGGAQKLRKLHQGRGGRTELLKYCKGQAKNLYSIHAAQSDLCAGRLDIEAHLTTWPAPGQQRHR
jgi:hypothetical protein